MNPPVSNAGILWPQLAADLGFRADASVSRETSSDASRASRRQPAYRNGSALSTDGSWLTLSERTPVAGDPLRELMGTPGLWRGLRDPAGDESQFVRSFGLPPVAALPHIDGGEDPEPDTADSKSSGSEPAWHALLEWTERTRSGRAVPGWPFPSADEIEQWSNPARLRVRAGSHVVEGKQVCDAGRVALEFSALVQVPADLAPARIAWLRELCHDAQEKWHMVRFGFDAAGTAVGAEVDLTGAPASCVPPLLELAHSALLNAAGWALPTLVLAANPSIDSAILDRPPPRAAQALDVRSGPDRQHETQHKPNTIHSEPTHHQAQP